MSIVHSPQLYHHTPHSRLAAAKLIQSIPKQIQSTENFPMPITQSRMIALIEEARDYQRAYLELRKLTDTWFNSELAAGGITSEQFREFMIQRAAMVQQPTGNQMAVEAYHFSKFAKDNVKSKERQRIRRGFIEAGQPVMRNPSTVGVKRKQREADYTPTNPQELLASMNENDLSDNFNISDFGQDNPPDAAERLAPKPRFDKEYFMAMGMTEAEAESQIKAMKDEGML